MDVGHAVGYGVTVGNGVGVGHGCGVAVGAMVGVGSGAAAGAVVDVGSGASSTHANTAIRMKAGKRFMTTACKRELRNQVARIPYLSRCLATTAAVVSNKGFSAGYRLR